MRLPADDYRALWRWHFYAGLFCIPFIIVLSITGSIYLFKPQIEAALDRPYDHLRLTGPAASAGRQVRAALAAVPGGRLDAYELPVHSDDAARVLVRDPSGEAQRVYVHPQTLRVLAVLRERNRPVQLVKRIHGELFMGDAGSIVVELAASWAIVMIVTGLYLWWPRSARAGSFRFAGVFYPRLHAGGRVFWRDLHAVTGVWISLLALFLLVSGLPWTTVWGEAFKQARRLAASTEVAQDWTTRPSAEHAEHMRKMHEAPADAAHVRVTLDEIVPEVAAMDLAPPVQISPPTARNPVWAVRSQAQNRPLRVSIDIDAKTGAIRRREDFAQRPLAERVVGVGIAAHEGQLFPPLNQALGVLTAIGLLALSSSAVVMWWRRRPSGALGAPPALANPRLRRGLAILITCFALLLPVLGASLILVALLERLILRRITVARDWLGLDGAMIR